jgi:hypothetical protein
MSNHAEISGQVEQDYDALLERMMPLAEKWLEESDGFIPFGAAITTDGELVGHMAGGHDSTTIKDAMHMLLAGLQERARAGKIRAACVCYNGRFEEDGESVSAIFTILEHVQGPATILYHPYRKNSDGIYEYAQGEGQKAELEIFVGSQ